jgi:hypothetical protein
VKPPYYPYCRNPPKPGPDDTTDDPTEDSIDPAEVTTEASTAVTAPSGVVCEVLFILDHVATFLWTALNLFTISTINGM